MSPASYWYCAQTTWPTMFVKPGETQVKTRKISPELGTQTKSLRNRRTAQEIGRLVWSSSLLRFR